jgi:two-component system, response regulator / RNA-binding antiterminator
MSPSALQARKGDGPLNPRLPTATSNVRSPCTRPEIQYSVLCTAPLGALQLAMRDPAQNLRVLIANEREERLAVVEPLVTSLGHEVIAREINSDDAGELAQQVQPDVALVGVGNDRHHALEMIDCIVKESACPVIAILGAADDEFVREAAKLGVFAYIVSDDPATWQNMIEIVLRRFAEYRSLEGAFGRRSAIEQAKGILMERHKIRGADAFSLLRGEARSSNRRVVDVAHAVVGGHPLLPPKT